ncbi:uncharacterized protein LOC26526479 [Drosophila erecta]|uniref:Uncharacterized protein n=1 Tax=Drosophila erecta TaxID=7220 RepID=A0A0Q5WC94_DROER|nr:uncharacterized protein LOC26526479 [Drosophila erecta]KQS70966.1 uncharacterized protein Dere_GG26655 [Drosophila erecta]
MRLCMICLVLLCVPHVSNTKPFLDLFGIIHNHFENKFSKLNEMINGNSNAKPVPDNTNPNSNTSPDKDDKKQFLDTLVKLCKSETGNEKPSGFDVDVAKQVISNLNTITNNISMPEIQLPPITVVIVKDEEALAKYQKESQNSKDSKPVIIIKRPSPKASKDTKPAPRSELKKSTKKGLTSDVKKCVLMKIKELNIVKV